jgi:hypothetical protein
MADFRNAGSKITPLLCLAALLLFAITSSAQSTKETCGLTSVIPQAGEEPKAKITVYAPLPGPLAARGVSIIEYCVQNLHIVPVFGPDALATTPRVGHLHVTVDDAAWHWADASGNPIILQALLRARTKSSSN